jgi:hypothetical protein
MDHPKKGSAKAAVPEARLAKGSRELLAEGLMQQVHTGRA